MTNEPCIGIGKNNTDPPSLASCFCFSFLFCGYLLERGGFHLLVAVKPWYEERNVYPSHLQSVLVFKYFWLYDSPLLPCMAYMNDVAQAFYLKFQFQVAPPPLQQKKSSKQSVQLLKHFWVFDCLLIPCMAYLNDSVWALFTKFQF